MVLNGRLLVPDIVCRFVYHLVDFGTIWVDCKDTSGVWGFSPPWEYITYVLYMAGYPNPLFSGLLRVSQQFLCQNWADGGDVGQF